MVCGFVVQFLPFWGQWKEKVLYSFFLHEFLRSQNLRITVSRFVLLDLYSELAHSVKIIDSTRVQIAMINFEKETKTASRSLQFCKENDITTNSGH